MNVVKFADLRANAAGTWELNPAIEQRTSLVTRDHSEMGKSYVVFECAFCRGSVRAYLWSLAGGGRRCPHCGSLIVSGGVTYGWKPVEQPVDSGKP